MLACVLNSEIAIQANIKIIRVFTTLREMTLQNKYILQKVEKLEKRVGMHDKELQVIFETIKKMIDQPPPKRNRIGFIRDE